MKKLLLLLLPVAAIGGTVDPTYTFTDFNLHPLVRRATQTPLAPLADYNGAILGAVPITQTNTSGGSSTFSNTIAGYSYPIQLDPPLVSVIRACGYPATISGPVNGCDYLGDIKNGVFYYLYPSNASGFFLTIPTNTPTDGQVVSRTGNQNKWVPFAASGG